MQTFNRICLEDFEVTDEHGKTFKVKRGKEYLTSDVNAAPMLGPKPVENHVIVFSLYWVPVPLFVFGGEVVE